MTAKVYEFVGVIIHLWVRWTPMPRSALDSSESSGPNEGPLSVDIQVEADSLEDARAEARRQTEAFLLEHDEVFQDGGEFFLYPEVGEPVEVDYEVRFEGLSIATSVALPPDLEGVRYCPEHGYQREWIVSGRERRCRECERRLVELREAVVDAEGEGES